MRAWTVSRFAHCTRLHANKGAFNYFFTALIDTFRRNSITVRLNTNGKFKIGLRTDTVSVSLLLVNIFKRFFRLYCENELCYYYFLCCRSAKELTVLLSSGFRETTWIHIQNVSFNLKFHFKTDLLKVNTYLDRQFKKATVQIITSKTNGARSFFKLTNFCTCNR